MITKQDLQFNEYKDSKLPAMIMLKNMGYEYLTPDEANKLRYNKQSEVILEGVLEDWLKKNNKIEYGQSENEFSESSIRNAINKLKYYTNKGLVQTNKDMYETLLTGESHPENVEGTIRSFNIKYIDWEQPENNVYHFTEEYTVERVGIKDRIRPDIVILDISMPSKENKSGIDVCEIVKKNSPKTKIIMLTASSQRANIIRAIKKGANDYIIKPFEEKQIKDSLQKVLKIKF